MPVKVIYGRLEELQTAIAGLRELAQQRMQYAGQLDESIAGPDGQNLRDLAYQSAGRMLDAARSLEYTVEGKFDQPTADEEKQELRALLDHLYDDVGYRMSGTLAEQLASMVEKIKEQRSQAFGLTATLRDEQRVKLEALRWIIKSALSSATHRSKDSRLHLALESLDAIQEELQHLDPDTLSRYTVWDWPNGSWNTRRLQADIHHKELKIQNLQARIAELEGSPKSETSESW